MFKFWDPILEPMLRSIDAKNIIEIGVCDGYCTRFLLQYCSQEDGHLDYIDPEQNFDLQEFQSQFGSIGTFHRGASLEVLPSLQIADAVLIDGDHNWYTVYNELQILDHTVKSSASNFPLVFFHDVSWPYGRRDLYYAPERIPPEFRLPYAQKGILPGVTELVEDGGLNSQLCNAHLEGGPRNGVLTAVEDFVRKSGVGTLYVVPLLFGLGILVPHRLAENQALMSEVLKWNSKDGLNTLLSFLERERVTEMCSAQATHASHQRLLSVLRQERAQIQTDLSDLRQEYARTRSKYDGLQKGCTELREKYEALQTEWTGLREEYAALQNECNGLRNECASLQSEMQAILDSRSWRWTSSLRTLSTKSRSHLKRLKG
jgi:FtsZ-binding cell division protein ZapB